MASVISGSTGSLASSGSSSGTNEDCVINEDHFSSSCSSLELEDIQEAIEGVGSCLVSKFPPFFHRTLFFEYKNFDLLQVRRTILETEERSDARKELVHRLIR